MHERPAHPCPTENAFDNALIAFGTSPYYAHLAAATAYCFHQFLTRSGDLRRVGSAALDCCDLACGRADVFFELLLSPWDFAAGALLIEEAGGVFTMPYEAETDFGKPACILAANYILLFLSLFRYVYTALTISQNNSYFGTCYYTATRI